MLNQDKLNKVRRILSAQGGAQVPVFKWGGQPFTFTSNGKTITIPYQDFSLTSGDWGAKGGIIEYNGQKYKVDAETGADFSSWHSENMHYKPENLTTQPNEFAQDKVAGYPIVENIQTPAQQKLQQKQTQALSTKEITSTEKSITEEADPSKIVVPGEKIKTPSITIPPQPILDLPPAAQLKQNQIDASQEQQALAESYMNSQVTGVTIPKQPEIIKTGSTSAGTGGDEVGSGDNGEGALDKSSVFTNTKGAPNAAGWGKIAGQAADMVTNMFVDKSEFASDDPTQGKGRQMYDAIADSAMAFAPVGTIVGGAMKAIGFINDIGGRKSDSFSADQNIIGAVGGSYGGTTNEINEAASKAGKQYGLFAGSARNKANRAIAEARRKQNIMGDIADEALDRRNMVASGLAGNAYKIKLQGGYNQNYMRAAKSGTKIEYFKKPDEEFDVIISEPIEEFKTGGSINTDSWEPVITEGTEILKEGGVLQEISDSWEPLITEDISTLKSGGKIRKNEEGEIVPEKCDVCGGKIVVQIHGEPVYLCEDCNKYFGIVPFKHKDGGSLEKTIEVIETDTTQKSVIPEGALHKNKHHLDEVGVDDSELTKKGIPVVDNNGDQQAEIELNEIIFTLEVTREIEKRYKEFYKEDTTADRKNELALEAGKLLWKEIIYNTDDRTGLINTLKQGGTLPAKQDSKIDEAFQEFLKTLPDNLRNYSEDTYRMKRYWELNNKPKDFKEALEKEMFTLEDDGFYHAQSVAYNPELDEYEFMKMPRHKTIWMEVEGWYNGMNFEPKKGFTEEQAEGNIENYVLTPKKGRGAEESRKFRQQYILDKSGPFWKYIPRNRQVTKKALGGTISQEDITDMVKQALINLLLK